MGVYSLSVGAKMLPVCQGLGDCSTTEAQEEFSDKHQKITVKGKVSTVKASEATVSRTL